MSDAKMKNENDVSYTILEFSIAMQIRTALSLCFLFVSIPTVIYILWIDTYVIIRPNFCIRSDRFEYMRPCPNSTNASMSGWVNDPPSSCAGPLLNNRSSVRTMHSSGTYRSVFGPQFHEAAPASGGHDGSTAGDGHDDESGAGAEEDETFASNDHQTPKGNGDDESKANESGDSSRDTSSETGAGDIEDDEDVSGRQSRVLPTPMVVPFTSGLQAEEGSDERSPHDDDHADEGEMQKVNDGEGGDERSPQDDHCAVEGDMQEVNDPGDPSPPFPVTTTRKAHRPITSRRWTAADSFGGSIFELIMCVHRGVMMIFCRMMKSTDKMKAEAKSRVVVISIKKQPKRPKHGFMPEGATVETISPIPYDVVKDLKGGY
ncbi:60S ribosomal L21-2 [Olea europaea subsp. europaea]|uniref:60S ribosomal L21-2 n=1 Tax=Olea europaea subsp. europaea TaxID=158383 RepID=A0A8S0R6Q4_OLEEU|nr:60S ribosomal L21-2 [Olea europaea subsp. europaea]